MSKPLAAMQVKQSAKTEETTVPRGYKRTEVGVIPEDWGVVSFGVLFEPVIIKKSIKDSTMVTFVGMQDVTESAQLTNQNIISYNKVKNGFTYFERGDVLLAKITPCFENGKGCHAVELKTEQGFGSTEFHVLRATESADPRFIYFWTTRSSFRIDLEAEMVGSAGHRRVPISAVASYKIPCPTKKEQTAIANALSDVDALISELEKLIGKKQAIKTATMQQLLTGRTRLPQFTLREDGSETNSSGTNLDAGTGGPKGEGQDGLRKGYKHSELGEVPEDWEVANFSQVLTIRHGKNQKIVESENGMYPIFATGGQIGWANAYLWNAPSVLIGRKGTINKPRYAEKPFWTVDTLFYSEFNDSADAKFIFYKFCMIDWMQYNEASGVPSLNASTIERVQTVIPRKPEQTAIATVLSDMDEEIQALEQRLSKTRQIKQGMMQVLLTGKIRLKGEADCA